ncbi:MAG: hypothetical protein ACXV4D_02550 [Ilumatobacteraceae bacterium]
MAVATMQKTVRMDRPMVCLLDVPLHEVWAAVPNCIAAIGREVESSDLANGEVVFCSGMAGSSSGERYVILVAPLGTQTQVSVSGTQRSRFGKPCEARIAKISNQFLVAMNEAVVPQVDQRDSAGREVMDARTRGAL